MKGFNVIIPLYDLGTYYYLFPLFLYMLFVGGRGVLEWGKHTQINKLVCLGKQGTRKWFSNGVCYIAHREQGFCFQFCAD